MLQSDSREGKMCRKSWRGSSARIGHMDANHTLDLSLFLQHLKIMDDMFHHMLPSVSSSNWPGWSDTQEAICASYHPHTGSALFVLQIFHHLACRHQQPPATLKVRHTYTPTSPIWGSSMSVTFCTCSVTTPFYSRWFASPILFFCTNSLMSSPHLQMWNCSSSYVAMHRVEKNEFWNAICWLYEQTEVLSNMLL